MPALLEPAAPGARIAISTLDAVEQTRLWLELGPEQATRTMLGALRTALLLGEQVVVDRNQVMEGIFFVAMSPDRLAWHLGLPPGAPLPLTVGLLNPHDGPSEPAGCAVPWPTTAGPAWGVPHDVATEIDLNYQAVAADPVRVSSPLVAITGEYERSSSDTSPSVNAPQPGPQWELTDAEYVPQEVWNRRTDAVLARSLIERGRTAWVDAMKLGRVAVEHWRRSPIDIGLALERARVSDPRVAPLAEALVGLEERHGVTGACQTVHHGPDRTGGAPCGRHHVSKRSLVVRWLDGEDVPDLVPSQMDPDIRARFDHDDLVSAFRWWVAAYYDAICDRDELRLLTLHDVSTDQAELAWGLAMAPESRWRSIAHRVSRRTSPTQRDVGVEGEIVDNLVDFTPAQFTQLQHLKVVDTQRLWSSRPDGRAMFDLALAVREIAGDHTSRARRLVITSLRWLALTSLAVMFALRDEGLVPVSGPVWASTFILLAVLAAFPYAETAALVQMSPGRMRSTLRLRDRP